jgi:hypothetical protein
MINSDNTRRAFLKKSEKSANKLVKEMSQEGWDFASMEQVDCVMFNTMKIQLN